MTLTDGEGALWHIKQVKHYTKEVIRLFVVAFMGIYLLDQDGAL